MIINRLLCLAVILLVLLFVGSAANQTMKGRFYVFVEDNICLSLRHRRNMTDACNPNDVLQDICVYKTSPDQGIYHSVDGSRAFCFDHRRKKFRVKKLKNSRKIRHERGRGRRGPKRDLGNQECRIHQDDIDALTADRSCTAELYEHIAGYYHISGNPCDSNSNSLRECMFLSVRKGKVTRANKGREKHRQIIRRTSDQLADDIRRTSDQLAPVVNRSQRRNANAIRTNKKQRKNSS